MELVLTDPEELEKFAQRLKAASLAIQELNAQIRSGLSRLGDSWRDAQYQEFASAFFRVQKVLQQFVSEAEKVVPQLLADADTIRRFQQHSNV